MQTYNFLKRSADFIFKQSDRISVNHPDMFKINEKTVVTGNPISQKF